MGKKRSLQENRTYQGNISCKDGHNKDRKGKDLTEAKEIKEGWQKYTKNYTRMFLMTWITMMVWSCKNSILKTEKHRETLKEYLNKQK